VKLHAKGAAVDLRGAQLDQLEQLFVDTRLDATWTSAATIS